MPIFTPILILWLLVPKVAWCFTVVATYQFGQTECMAVCQVSNNCGTYIKWEACTGGSNQQWTFESNRLISTFNQQCLAVQSFEQSGRHLLATSNCQGSNVLQNIAVQGDTLKFLNSPQGECIGVALTGFAANCTTQQDPRPVISSTSITTATPTTGATPVTFTFIATFQFGQTQCMGVCANPNSCNTYIQFSACTGAANQNWQWRPEYNRVVNAANQECLDIFDIQQNERYLLVTSKCVASKALQAMTIQGQTLNFMNSGNRGQCIGFDGSFTNTAFSVNCTTQDPLPLINSAVVLSATPTTGPPPPLFTFVATFLFGQKQCMGVCPTPGSCNTYIKFEACTGNLNQQWEFQTDKVISRFNEQCLAILDINQSGKYLLVTDPCLASNPLQELTIQSQTLNFVNSNHGLCIGFDGSFGNTAFTIDCANQDPLPLINSSAILTGAPHTSTFLPSVSPTVSPSKAPTPNAPTPNAPSSNAPESKAPTISKAPTGADGNDDSSNGTNTDGSSQITASLPTTEAKSGFSGFVIIILSTIIGALIVLLMEYIRGWKSYYQKQIRLRDRLLFRVKNHQRDVNSNPVNATNLMVKASDMLEHSNEAMLLLNEIISKFGVDYVPQFKGACQKAVSAYRLSLFAFMQTVSNNEYLLDPPVVKHTMSNRNVDPSSRTQQHQQGRVVDIHDQIPEAEIAQSPINNESLSLVLRELEAIFTEITSAMGQAKKDKLDQAMMKIRDLGRQHRLSHNPMGEMDGDINLLPTDDTWLQGLYSARVGDWDKHGSLLDHGTDHTDTKPPAAASSSGGDGAPLDVHSSSALPEPHDTTTKTSNLAGVIPVTGANFAKAERLARGLVPRFLKPQIINANRHAQCLRRFFPRSFLHPWFYGLVSFMSWTIFLSFAAKIDRTKSGLDSNHRVVPGIFVGSQPFQLGGYGQTFLPVPPQYNLEKPVENATIPILYGVMHCALFFLGMLPIAFMRGFWRDLSQMFPLVRTYLPVDDFIFVHRMFAWALFVALVLGAAIWLGTMGSECFGNEDLQACVAFYTGVSSPVDNVLFLRVLVWCLWFPIMPLMNFARRGVPRCLPSIMKKYWYEIIYYSHVTVGFGVIMLALFCRFVVFYPVIISWFLYIVDSLRESWYSTHWLKLANIMRTAQNNTAANAGNPSSSMRFKIFESRDQRPVSIRVHFDLPERFRGVYKAGQWVYIQVPEIDHYWHPFSIVSSMNEPVLSLHMGIQADQNLFKKNGQHWEMPVKAQSWTYQLYNKLRSLPPDEQVQAKFRGPYGSAFMSCFNPEYTGCVVIGAGTGLTAAESVLKQLIYLKSTRQPCPEAVWFVWSCRKVDDLIWCWESLFDAIRSIVDNRSVCDSTILQSINADRYNTLDWLGITIYVTQLTSEDLERMVEYAQSFLSPDDPVGLKITDWMLGQLVAGAMDDVDTNIKSLLASVSKKLAILQPFKSTMTVAFCGPSALASCISSSISEIGGNIEFSTDSQ